MSYLPLIKQRMADALVGVHEELLDDPSERLLAYFAAGMAADVNALEPWNFDDLDKWALQFERRRRAALSHASEIAEGGIDE